MSNAEQQQKEYATDKRNGFPLCRDCKHVCSFQFGDASGQPFTGPYRGVGSAFCNREHDLIDGYPVTCSYMRGPHGGCAQPGYLFEPKEITLPADVELPTKLTPGKIVKIVKFAQCRACPQPADCYQADRCLKRKP